MALTLDFFSVTAYRCLHPSLLRMLTARYPLGVVGYTQLSQGDLIVMVSSTRAEMRMVLDSAMRERQSFAAAELVNQQTAKELVVARREQERLSVALTASQHRVTALEATLAELRRQSPRGAGAEGGEPLSALEDDLTVLQTQMDAMAAVASSLRTGEPSASDLAEQLEVGLYARAVLRFFKATEREP